MNKNTELGFDPKKLEREVRPFYIGANEQDQKEMLLSLNLKSLDDLYAHIDDNLKMRLPQLPAPMEYQHLIDHVNELSFKNKKAISFLGDGLQVYQQMDVVGPICGIRGLTTAYTPYQPERSQGTLQTLWIYQSLISQLTGFEAINASLYDRSTCLFEALNCSLRLVKNSSTVILAETLYPADIEVIKTHAIDTDLKLLFAPIDANTGKIDQAQLKKLLSESTGLAAFAFPQITNMGTLEDVDALADICAEAGIKSIAVVDPMLLGKGGLKAPIHFGKKGADMIVAEGQHLAINANFGGPGLGIFGIRYNDQDKNSIRSTAGRYVGKALDSQGRECKALILSTREQHIRREKATSNICSNQSFVATIAGAAMLRRGDEGFEASIKKARQNALMGLEILTSYEGIELKFAQTPFMNEITIKVSDAKKLLKEASLAGIHLGVNITGRHAGIKDELILVSFNDCQSNEDLSSLNTFLSKYFTTKKAPMKATEIPSIFLRTTAPEIPQFSFDELLSYYQKLGTQNLSPDEGIYPLGSCTMKYNPHINDYAASLPSFTMAHPEAPESDVQGCLEVLYEIQEMFKAITGLPGVTTEPVAGAQGELVGLKLFQGYHRDRGEDQQRRIIIIPRSAHGTNPATATMAGYDIHTVEALPNGEINLDQIREFLTLNGKSVAGIMVTNPNTAGIFESRFKEMSDLIHAAGGLVYMDGANMNAVAGVVDLNALGVDAVHNNLHKTWTIPHGGGGPGDGMVAVSHRLVDYLPGIQVRKTNHGFETFKTPKSIGRFHRHYGNFAHKIRAYTYIKALGNIGVKQMSQVAVLSARYLQEKLSKLYPTLPSIETSSPRMHEFILTLSPETFKNIEASGTPKANTIARIGKLFLDFGFHAPTVAFPEQYGLMFEPTESYTKAELDKFSGVVETILKLITDHPEVLKTVPHFTPIDRVDEVSANKTPMVSEKITKKLPEIIPDRVPAAQLRNSTPGDLCQMILKAHQSAKI